MSQIFDALLRSEVERAGNGAATGVEATELLRSVERESAVQFAPASAPIRVGAEASATRQALLERVAVASNAEIASSIEALETNRAGQQASSEQPDDIWSRFGTLPAACLAEGRLVCYTDRATPTAEAFRLLGVRLRELRQDKPLNKLLITSTVPREGKSTVASNLACTLGRKKEEKVLLLEGDIRRPTLSGIFNLAKVPGISQLLQGTHSLEQCIYRLEGPGIWIMPAGSMPTTPLELLQSRRLPSLMNRLTGLFDWVIVDSPPVLPLADTSIWSQMVDGILLVTRRGVTEKKQLERGLEALDREKVIGALLNGSQASTYSSYYYTPSSESKNEAG